MEEELPVVLRVRATEGEVDVRLRVGIPLRVRVFQRLSRLVVPGRSDQVKILTLKLLDLRGPPFVSGQPISIETLEERADMRLVV